MIRPLDRRTFLRAAGTAVALPALEAMMPSARAANMAQPKRLIVYFVPNGIHMPAWTPATDGPDYELSPILSSLAPVKDALLVVTGLANRPAVPETTGDHACGTASFATATHIAKTEGDNIKNGISFDQVAAATLADKTPFRSLQLGTEGGAASGSCDSGYSCAYARNISWANERTPLAKEVNSQALFDRLFRGLSSGSAGDAARRKQYRQSVLDFVKDDATRLRARLGTADQRKVDEYFTGLRELEQRLANAGSSCAAGVRPADSDDARDVVKNMSDLIVLALQCDMTRVVSFMLGNALSNRVYRFLGINEGHHQISHHMGIQTNLDHLQQIDTWEVSQLAYLLQRLRSVTAPDGTTLLDDTLVFFSSDIEDGNAHHHYNLPVLVAGKAGGFPTGRHVRLASEQPIAALFVSILQALGVPQSTFGDDGLGPLASLK